MPTNHGDKDTGSHAPPTGDFVDHPNSGAESTKLGYETTDVNVGGVAVFLAGLFGFVLIFFGFCYLLGQVINNTFRKQDGASDKWHQTDRNFAGAHGAAGDTKAKLENLKSSSAMEQAELNHITQTFPNPRLDIDDGNQATADLHAKEDLLLDHYSSVPGQPVRIPIDQAMRLIVQRQLPVAAAPAPGTMLAGDKTPVVAPPLTSGFARTGPELDAIEARAQKMSYGKAEEHAALR